jgi:hypothetical protein
VSDAPLDPREPILETQVAAATILAAGADPGPRFTVGGVLSRTLRVWWAHLGAFTVMSLVVFAPMLAAVGLVSWDVLQRARAGAAPETAAGWASLAAVALAGGGATLALSVVQMGAVTYGTIRWLHGERAPLGPMVRAGFRRGLPVVGTGFLLWLGTMVGMILLVVPGIMFLVAASLAVPSAVVEQPGVTGAIRRSFALTRGYRWPLFAAGLVILVVQWLLSAALQVASMLLVTVLPPAWALGAGVFVGQLGNVLFSVVPVVAVAVCYHDLRLSKEGADTAELARVFE